MCYTPKQEDGENDKGTDAGYTEADRLISRTAVWLHHRSAQIARGNRFINGTRRQAPEKICPQGTVHHGAVSRQDRGGSEIITMTTEITMAPENIGAEAALIGAILVDNRYAIEQTGTLAPEDFWQPEYAAIYRAALAVHKAGHPTDVIHVLDALGGSQSDQARKIGGAARLMQLQIDAGTTVNVTHHATIIRENALKRNLLRISGDIAGLTADTTIDAHTAFARAAAMISDADIGPSSDPVTPLADPIVRVVDKMASGNNADAGIATGWADLDRVLTGLQPGHLIIIAGRPSSGKTSFALNLLQQIKCGALLFSIEMSAEELAQRYISSASGVPSTALRTGPTESQWQNIATIVDDIKGLPIWVDDAGSQTLANVIYTARRLCREQEIGLIAVDYLQLLRGSRSESREREVADMSAGLKGLARDLNVPVVCLSQLSRQAENREGNTPRLSDLRESGAIEQDADQVLFLFRPEMYDAATPRQGEADLIIAKNRSGPTGTITMGWEPERTRFVDFAAGTGR